MITAVVQLSSYVLKSLDSQILKLAGWSVVLLLLSPCLINSSFNWRHQVLRKIEWIKFSVPFNRFDLASIRRLSLCFLLLEQMFSILCLNDLSSVCKELITAIGVMTIFHTCFLDGRIDRGLPNRWLYSESRYGANSAWHPQTCEIRPVIPAARVEHIRLHVYLNFLFLLLQLF